MHRATKSTPFTVWLPSGAIRLLLLLSVVSGIPCRALAAGLLDLTLPRPANAGEIPPLLVSLPGPPPTPLLLKVTITNLWPAVLTVTGRINADILIQNVGKEPVLIPASSDFANVMKAGNHDRRILLVGLQLTHPHGSKPIRMGIGTAVGSETVPGSMITLAPQETLVIRGAEILGETTKWWEDGLTTGQVTAKAIISEEFVEDEKYASKNWSTDAISGNSVTFTWTRSNQ